MNAADTDAAPLSLADAGAACRRVLDEVERAVVGKREALTHVLTAVVAGGHVLIEDFPGLGKTLAARSFAQALGLEFRRAQFTPDQLPADLTGSYVYDQSPPSSRSVRARCSRGSCWPMRSIARLRRRKRRCSRRCRSIR